MRSHSLGCVPADLGEQLKLLDGELSEDVCANANLDVRALSVRRELEDAKGERPGPLVLAPLCLPPLSSGPGYDRVGLRVERVAEIEGPAVGDRGRVVHEQDRADALEDLQAGSEALVYRDERRLDFLRAPCRNVC